jgi:phage baseplate assembly protein W
METNILNTSDKTGNVSITSRRKGYSDINLSLQLHPTRKDIMPLKDDAALKNSVKNLVLTSHYERPFHPELGGGVRGLLFEPADAITEIALKDAIESVLADHEPRINQVRLDIKNEADQNSYRITIGFNIKQDDSQAEVEILLRRLR